MLDIIVPMLLVVTASIGLHQKQDIYTQLTDGAAEGLKLLFRIVPALIILLTAVRSLRESGALELLTDRMTPFFSFFGIPPETAPLVLLRPFSGSAALAVGADLMRTYGVDSAIGKTAAIMLGSTETTFYTISVYFGAANVKKSRYAIPASFLADLTGFIMASLTARWFSG